MLYRIIEKIIGCLDPKSKIWLFSINGQNRLINPPQNTFIPLFWASITIIMPENINIWFLMIIISVFTDNRLFFQTYLHFVANLDQPRAKFEIWQSCLKHTYLIHFGSDWTKECLKLTTTNKAITCFLNYYSIVPGSDLIANTSCSKLLGEIFF